MSATKLLILKVRELTAQEDELRIPVADTIEQDTPLEARIISLGRSISIRDVLNKPVLGVKVTV